MMVAQAKGEDESTEYYSAYITPIFNVAMERAIVTCTNRYEENPDKIVTWTYTTTSSTGDTFTTNCETTGYDAYVDLNVYFNDTGLMDLINCDGWTNDDAHSNGSVETYSETDENAEGYNYWNGWYDSDGEVRDQWTNQHSRRLSFEPGDGIVDCYLD